jgi:peptide/nickel transport system ATP-binding protein
LAVSDLSSSTLSPPNVVDIRDLTISYRSRTETVAAVCGVSFSIARAETVAIVGESGSGKSTLAHALMGLLADNARLGAGAITVEGQDMTRAVESRWRQLRGRVVSLVPQDPMVGLNPTMRIGRQIAEAVFRARGGPVRTLDMDVLALLEQVGLDQPALRVRQYPHELSGGMRQRVLIAIALAGCPAIMIADEPTSALDVTVQRKILDHLEALVRQRGISLLIVTHDLGVAADRADRILVMQRGRIVEHGPPSAVLGSPVQAYTRDLIAAAPALAGGAELRLERRDESPGREILRFEAVCKSFEVPGAPSWFGQRKTLLPVLESLSFSAQAGQTLAIVGESGSGKTTALRIALGLEKATSGRVVFDGYDLTQLGWREFRPLRRRVQLVQQNPYAALDPRHSVFDSIVEPLRSFGLQHGKELEITAQRLMDQVRLPRSMLNRLPRELSGGQRQRVAIARALALGPELLFLDEPLAALDVSVQAQLLELLGELQRELGVSYVFVSHDLTVVATIAHSVVVLRRGRVVEQGPIAKVFGNPTSDHTRELLAAVPGRRRTLLPGRADEAGRAGGLVRATACP